MPLIRLTLKDATFVGGTTQGTIFYALKLAFTKAPILMHFDPTNPIVVNMDASDYAITAFISQISHEDSVIHPICWNLVGKFIH